MQHFIYSLYPSNPIRVHSHEEGANFTMNERQKIREKCKAIIDLGVNVLINHGQIYSVAEQYFAENGVICVQISDFLECEVISLATGSPILSDVQGVLPSQLGNAKCVEEIVMGDSKVVKISGCPNPKACTILLRAPTLSLLDECERSVHDALCVVNAAIKSKKLTGGGGCVQIEIAKRIREASIYEVGKEQLAMQAFAETLESLPLILAQNGGYDGTAILAACRQKHQSPEGLWFGVDMKRGKPADMVNEAHVLEPSDVLVSAIQSATEAAEMILRIDQNVNLKEENKDVKPF